MTRGRATCFVSMLPKHTEASENREASVSNLQEDGMLGIARVRNGTKVLACTPQVLTSESVVQVAKFNTSMQRLLCRIRRFMQHDAPARCQSIRHSTLLSSCP